MQSLKEALTPNPTRPSTPVPRSGTPIDASTNTSNATGLSATTMKPLNVTFSLASAPVPASAAQGWKVQSQDVFDELDKLRPSFKIEGLDDEKKETTEPSQSGGKTINSQDQRPGASATSRHCGLALSDTTSLLFPLVNVADIREEVEMSIKDDERLPSWLTETSRRVMAIASTWVDVIPEPTLEVMEQIQQADEIHESLKSPLSRISSNPGTRKEKALRLAVGCEDGSVFIFGSVERATRNSAPHSPSPNGVNGQAIPTVKLEGPTRRPTASFDIHTASNYSTNGSTSPSTSISRSHPTSPPLSPSARSRRPSISLSRNNPIATTLISPSRPSFTQRSMSSNSISSIDPGRRRTNVAPSNHSPLHDASIVIAPRPRKASATIGVSLGSSTPSDDSAMSPVHQTYDLRNTDTSPRIGSSSMSRVSTTNGGQRVVSPSSASISSSVTGESTKKHHRAKDSITTGIGLWETESNAATSVGAISPPVEETGTSDWPRGEDQELAAENESGTGVQELNMLFDMRLGGTGEIVGIKVVEGSRLGSEEGGRALIILRRKGHLSAHSLVDGRAFASRNVSGVIPLEQRDGQIDFVGLELIPFEDTTFALCLGSYGTGFVSVDLDTFLPQPSVEGGTGPGGAAIIFKQGIHFLISAAPSRSTSDAPPEVVARPVTLSNDAGIGSSTKVAIDMPHSAGTLEGLKGVVRGFRNCADDMLAFDSSTLVLFTIRHQQAVTLALTFIGGVLDVSAVDYNAILVSTASELRYYRLEPTSSDAKNVSGLFGFVLVDKRAIEGAETTAVLSSRRSMTSISPQFIVSHSFEVDRRSLSAATFARPSSQDRIELRKLFSSNETVKEPRVTCALRVDADQVVLGYNSGDIRLLPLSDLGAVDHSKTLGSQLSGAISLLELVELAGRRILVAGGVDGSSGAWNLSDWEELGRWRLFASPVSHVAYIQSPGVAQFEQTLAFVSANSPVALVSLFPPQLLFILPGTRSPVESISTSGKEVLIVYAHGLARICDVEVQELRRSMDAKTARDVLAGGKWKTWFSLASKQDVSPPASTLIDALLTLDLRTELDDAQNQLPWAEKKRSKADSSTLDDEPPHANGRADDPANASLTLQSARLDSLRFALSHLATPGLDEDTDQLLYEYLGVPKVESLFPCAMQSSGALCFPVTEYHSSPWTSSPTITAQRLLHIVCLLRYFLNFPDTERHASQAIVYYTNFLEESVGSAFEFPSLTYFADFWIDKSTEVQQAARTLFGSYLAASSDARVEALVERWQDALPSRQGEAVLCEGADQAVLVIGLIACERFALLTAGVLKALTTSIVTYIGDESHPYHQSIATELCARGFGIFQNYVDAMALVRDLFSLATGRNPLTPAELRTLAKHATLQVAAVNTPLFMTTLLYDILNASTAPHRNASLKLLGFMIRKKPLVLLTSLPRLAEAVVKSLDPTVTSLRQTVHQAATVILNELVRTYPSIDFHGKSQRLAVGTHEGAAIIYDLKTATRMYVLEGHKHAVTAISWSPDGHRLVSVALEESKVVVWKVGIGLFSLLMPGAAPRQTTGLAAVTGSNTSSNGSTPFKQYEFHVGDEALMTNAATLEWVTFDWPAERTVRLRIRETSLNFGC